MSGNLNPEKWKRVASHCLANEDNDGKVILNTHRNARARAIEEEQQKRAAQQLQLAQAAARREQAKSGSNGIVISHPTVPAPALTATTLLTMAPGPIDSAGSSAQQDPQPPLTLDNEEDSAGRGARKTGSKKKGEQYFTSSMVHDSP
jgi:hypothetical protein